MNCYGYSIVKANEVTGKFESYTGNFWTDLNSGSVKIYKTKDEAKTQLERLLSKENKLLFIVTLGIKK